MRKLAVLLAAGLVAIGVAGPAEATTTTVHLDVDQFGAIEEADCDVTVPTGSDGLDVLDQAQDDGCIDSYDTEGFSFGQYVTCINDICEQPSMFPTVTWLIYLEDGSFAEFGVSELSFPADGETLSFSYEPWPVHAPCFVVGVGCPGEEL